MAVKWLIGEGNDGDFLQEIEILKKVRHPHVIEAFGVSRDEETGTLRLVTELLDCSLLDFCRTAIFLDNAMSLAICLQITKGMDHLVKNGVLHRDLAARNVLVRLQGSDVPTTKLCDLGLGKVMESTYYTLTTPGATLPLKWTSPEALTMKKFSEASDVWSFGVTMWEVYSRGIEPYAGWQPRELVTLLKQGQRLEKPESCLDPGGQAAYDLMLSCWTLEPRERPTFAQLHDRLERMQEDQVDLDLRQFKETSDDAGSYVDCDDSGYAYVGI